MDKVYIVFWTQGGNTGAMAAAIGEGVQEAGKEAVYLSPAEADIEMLKELPAFAIGCPAMGDEVLEETEMEPFMEAADGIISGKQIGLFGSYGWGDGQWMRDWVDRVQGDGAEVIGGEGVMAHEAPDDDAVAACKELGRKLAEI